MPARDPGRPFPPQRVTAAAAALLRLPLLRLPLLCVPFLAASPVAGQEVTGLVVDEESERPLPGVEVRLVDSAGTVSAVS